MIVKKVDNPTLELPLPRSDVKDNSKRLNDGRTMAVPWIPQCNVIKFNVTESNINPQFDAFWIQYPRKAGKFTAKRSWEKINPDQDLQKKILESLERFKKSMSWMKDNGKFIPHPTTWLNQKRWEDEVEIYESKSIVI